MSGGSSWRSARFLVVDVETTGLDLARDEIVSFAALPVEDGRVLTGAGVGGLVRPERRAGALIGRDPRAASS